MSETLNSWNYRQNRISFNFACPFLSARGSWPNSRWLPGTNLLTGITRKKVTVHKRKKFGTFTTDRLIQVRLLIPNQPISSREELYSPVWHILKNCYKLGRWSRVMKHEEKIYEDERSRSPAISQGNSHPYLLISQL